MARLPRPPKDYEPLAIQRELKAASDGKPVVVSTKADQSRPNSARDYRRTLYEGLFQ